MNTILRRLSSWWRGEGRVARPQAKPTRSRLRMEELEGRDCPSVMFASFSDGVWAYNNTNASWRHLTNTAQATVMTEGSDGTLFGSFQGAGTYRYNYSS